MAQLFTFGDAGLEMLYELCRNLRKKLPYERDEMPTEILDYIDLSSIAIARGVHQSIGLTSGESELDPMGSNLKAGKLIDEKERLSLILKGINESFGVPEDVKANEIELYERVKNNEQLGKVLKHNDRGAAKEKYDEVVGEELRAMFAGATKFYQLMEEDASLKEAIMNKLFEELYENANAS